MDSNVVSDMKDCRKIVDLTNKFRDLWAQHVMWTRSFIISTAANLGDLNPVTKRLLRNPADFAEALKPYYGEEKAQKFAALLTEHLNIAARLVNAAKAGDTNAVSEERKKWYDNADKIAGYLAGINPYWSKNEWKMMLYDHLKLTESEAVERLSGRYDKDVALFDAIEEQADLMADYMTRGVNKQFK